MFDTCHLHGRAINETWLTLEQFAVACRVEPEWLRHHIEAGMFIGVECVADKWHVVGDMVLRARLMRQLERDFDAVPACAAPEGDSLDEMDDQRERLLLATLD